MRPITLAALLSLLGTACGTPTQTTNVYVLPPTVDAAADDAIDVAADTTTADTTAVDSPGADGDGAPPSFAIDFPVVGTEMYPSTEWGMPLKGTSSAGYLVGERKVPADIAPTRFDAIIRYASLPGELSTCSIVLTVAAPDGHVETIRVPVETGSKLTASRSVLPSGHSFAGTVQLRVWGEGCGSGDTLYIQPSTFTFAK